MPSASSATPSSRRTRPSCAACRIDGVEPDFDAIASGKYKGAPPAVRLREEAAHRRRPRPRQVHRRVRLGEGAWARTATWPARAWCRCRRPKLDAVRKACNRANDPDGAASDVTHYDAAARHVRLHSLSCKCSGAGHRVARRAAHDLDLFHCRSPGLSVLAFFMGRRRAVAVTRRAQRRAAFAARLPWTAGRRCRVHARCWSSMPSARR